MHWPKRARNRCLEVCCAQGFAISLPHILMIMLIKGLLSCCNTAEQIFSTPNGAGVAHLKPVPESPFRCSSALQRRFVC